ncbi:MAG: DUF4124 domain-containing protein [Myxococcota bacterium]|nr:DUF4124 domain-containing protein [Myxococcota bacterium]
MRSWLARRIGLVMLLLAFGAADASAEIYRWVDENGTPHFTDQIEEVPPEHRPRTGDAADATPSRGSLNVVAGLHPRPAPAAPMPGAAAAPAGGAATQPLAALQGGEPDFGALLSAVGAVSSAGIAALLIGAVVVFAISLLLLAAFLKLGCRVCGQDPPALGKAMGICAVQMVAGFLIGIVLALLLGVGPADPGRALQMQALNFGVGFLANAAVLRAMLCDSFGKSLVIALVTMLIALAVGVGLGLAAALLVAVFA